MKMKCPATGKVRHRTKEEACWVQRKYRYREIMNTYRCPHCKDFHLGKSHNNDRFQGFIDRVRKLDRKKAQCAA